MDAAHLRQIEDLVDPLLRTLDAIAFIQRHLHPVGYAHLLERVEAPADALRAARSSAPWPDPYSAMRPLLDEASDHALAAIEGLHAAAEPPEDMMRAYRALRRLPPALAALYPLAGILPPVNRFFIEPALRENQKLQARLAKPAPDAGLDTGVLCLGDDPDARDALWLYVPETCAREKPLPLVVALHGGGGRGRDWLWSWVRAARSLGAIVVAPTSHGGTWAIQGEDRDTPRLKQIVDFLHEAWPVDPARILLTGMSDGGTFAWTSGLEAGSPFTHLAPAAAAFHPMLAQMADADRMRGLPIHILHGAQDWMFPVSMAREADRAMRSAGANVTFREIPDLSHTYETDLSALILEWLLA